MVPSFLLTPAHVWPAHCWAHYVMGACSSPLVNTVVLGLYDQIAKVYRQPRFGDAYGIVVVQPVCYCWLHRQNRSRRGRESR